MSIVETNKIDIVATRPDSSVVKLVITDHLGWEDFESHARLLQAKVNTYLQFVESGQLVRTQAPKIPDGADLHIALVLQYPPTTEAEELFLQVRKFLSGGGDEVRRRSPPSGALTGGRVLLASSSLGDVR